jgi:hypothetical protein
LCFFLLTLNAFRGLSPIHISTKGGKLGSQCRLIFFMFVPPRAPHGGSA